MPDQPSLPLPLPDANADRPAPPIDERPQRVVPCDDLDEGLGRFTDAGFTLLAIGPADDPQWALLSHGHGPTSPTVRLERRRSAAMAPPATATQPLTTDASASDDRWVVGRAGMRYRDLLPDRWGGQFIASHIHIPNGGPVPDYVHYHHVDFQLIFCYRGWVRVVYQDQGDPFLLESGDAILQAPGIRHQVLEASDDTHVIEISSPAEHATFVEHQLTLPNGVATGRRYGGQAYVHHRSSTAPWAESAGGDLRRQSFFLEAATSGRYSASVTELGADHRSDLTFGVCSDVDFQFIVVLDGRLSVSDDGDAGSITMDAGAALALDGTSRRDARAHGPVRLLTVCRHRT